MVRPQNGTALLIKGIRKTPRFRKQKWPEKNATCILARKSITFWITFQPQRVIVLQLARDRIAVGTLRRSTRDFPRTAAADSHLCFLYCSTAVCLIHRELWGRFHPSFYSSTQYPICRGERRRVVFACARTTRVLCCAAIACSGLRLGDDTNTQQNRQGRH